jgi:hypothetical protein
MAILNVGIAGGAAEFTAVGEILHINQITDHSTGRFAPRDDRKKRLQRRPVVTVDLPVAGVSLGDTLVDMEATGFFQAASTFLPPIESRKDSAILIPRHCHVRIKSNVSSRSLGSVDGMASGGVDRARSRTAEDNCI